jgi:Flp pilus assembly protein TadG
VTSRNESGQVTAFVVVMMMALLLMAGLVIDGGMTLAAKRRAINEAEAAARAGAQAIDVAAYRATGEASLEPNRARQLAMSYIEATGDVGTVQVVDNEVRVEVTHSRPTSILGIAGLNETTVTGIGVAEPVRGVEVPE